MNVVQDEARRIIAAREVNPADLSRFQSLHRIPDLGEDDLDAARGVVWAVPAVLLAWALVALLAIVWRLWL